MFFPQTQMQRKAAFRPQRLVTSFSVSFITRCTSAFALFVASTLMLVSSADGKFETRLKYLNEAMVRFHFSETATSIVRVQPRGTDGGGQCAVLSIITRGKKIFCKN